MKIPFPHACRRRKFWAALTLRIFWGFFSEVTSRGKKKPQKPAIFCGFLRFSAVFCSFLQLQTTYLADQGPNLQKSAKIFDKLPFLPCSLSHWALPRKRFALDVFFYFIPFLVWSFHSRLKISILSLVFQTKVPKGTPRTKNTTDSKFTSKFVTAIVKHYGGHFETPIFKGKLSSKSLQIVKNYGSSKTLRNWVP